MDLVATRCLTETLMINRRWSFKLLTIMLWEPWDQMTLMHLRIVLRKTSIPFIIVADRPKIIGRKACCKLIQAEIMARVSLKVLLYLKVL